MKTICQACGYQRKSSDQAPDWECPACGKAYSKTSHGSPGSLSGYAQDFPSKSGNRSNEGLVWPLIPSNPASDKAKQKNNKKYLWVAVAFGFFQVVGIPILADPSSASAVLLHGDVGFLCIALLVVLGLIAAGKHMSARVDANNPKSSFAFTATFFALFFTVLFIVFAVWLGGIERVEAKIQRNGQRVMADVIRIYSGGCGKHSCSIDVEYAFTPVSETDGAPLLLHGYSQLGDRSNDPDVVYARKNQRVPIAYEIDHPQASALNFNDEVFRLDHGQRYRSTVTLLGEIFLGVFLLVLAVAGLTYRSKSDKQSNPDRAESDGTSLNS
jgi:hypothetical protein